MPIVVMMGMYPVLRLVVPDRFLGIKQLQFLMGLRKLIYWGTTFVWDVAMLVISFGLMTLLMKSFPDNFKLGLWPLFCITLVYGSNMLLVCYVASFVVNKAKNAYNLLLNVVLLSYIGALVLEMTMLILLKDKPWLKYLDILNVLPPYFMVGSTMKLLMLQATNDGEAKDVFIWDNVGKRLLAQGIWAIAMILLVVMFEAGITTSIRIPFPKRKSAKVEVAGDGELVNEQQMMEGGDDAPKNGAAARSGSAHSNAATRMWKDGDVAREEQEIDGGGADTRLLLAKHVEKRYGNKLAVNGTTFGVKAQECFGLLGVNGAGKSTLFRMLTGVEKPTAGIIQLLGKAIWQNYSNMSQHMSYCPQENVLYDQLTVTEHLHLYGRIRGAPTDQRVQLIDYLLNELGLDMHAAKKSKDLSGGNKRKLNFAISVLTQPDIIFLDEVSTGMDPMARRAAWGALQQLQRQGCAAVVTTHSMEEAEALSNRLVVMVNGQFRCMGSVQYLKDKFGNTYNVKLRLAPDTDIVNTRDSFVARYPDTKTVEQRTEFLEVQIPSRSLKLSDLFSLIHAMKRHKEINDFSVSQTTLEHVFVNMAKDQA